MRSRSSISSSSPDISVIVTAHRESLLVHRALKSVYAAIETAEKAELRCELLVVLDGGDHETRTYIEQFPIKCHRLIEVQVGDAGAARNIGARHAIGRYVAFLDADDLYCTDWLRLAYEYAEKSSDERLLLHSEYNVYFEAQSCLARYHAYGTPGMKPFGLVAANYWTSILFFRRALMDDRQFPCIVRGSGYGYEDWHFVAEQLAMGGNVQTVPGTCNFVRRKLQNSRLTEQNDLKCILPPTSFLDPIRVARQFVTAREFNTEENLALTTSVDESVLQQKVTVWGKVKREMNRVIEKDVLRRSRPVPPPEVPIATPNESIDFLWSACRAAHEIEPKVFPSAQLFADVRDPASFAFNVADCYSLLCRFCRVRPTHVFLVPWLKKGGSDLETLNYIQAVREASDVNRVVVIGTSDSDSPWSTRLPRDVPFIPFGKVCRDVPTALHVQLLATFLVQLQPRIIHNVNSAEGYLAFREHGAALRQGSQLFASVFCEDITEEGRIVGYAFDQLPDCFHYLAGVFADNARILDLLHSMFGLPREQLHLHYQPIEAVSPVAPRPPDERLSVLWAGRLDRQKSPDLLITIADRLGDSSIDFTIYGSTVLGQGDWAQQWELSPNIVYRGAFDRLDSLPLEEFDVFLHTAQWEGMPNVLLEALSAGLPVVASAVGGVPELIEDNVTGLSVSPHDDINSYCSALRALHADRNMRARMASAGRAVVNERHSWSAFCAALRRVPGYAHPPEWGGQRGRLEVARQAA